VEQFPFAWTRPYRVAAAPFLVTPGRAYVRVGDGELVVRFGPWTLRTALDNVAGCETTEGYAFVKTAGPPHLSLADRGVTFATNGERGLCICFHDPVPGIDPMGRIRHPAATVTVADLSALQLALRC
jgi:hypothetical protein